MKKISQLFIFIFFNLIAVIFLFFISEVLLSRHLSGTISTLYQICCLSDKPLAERLHTGYDPLLGWVNLPNVYIKDMYGDGKYLKTNGQSFRNNNDFSLSPSENKIRIICSGDSFTLGYGVDNDHTWCQQLVSFNKHLETVNLGQGGYGIDQAYLWYKRDGTKLEHDIHIFAFINSDFARMKNDQFGGYSKPVLKLQDGGLVIKNVPVPKPSFYRVWLNNKLPAIRQLYLFDLLTRLFPKTNQDDNQIKRVIAKVFQDLQQVNQLKHSTLVVVYLPTRSDYKEREYEPWRQFMLTEAKRNNFLYIDFFDEFRSLPPQTQIDYFISDKFSKFPRGAGHYTEEGNSFIARLLYDKLLAIPEISDKLKP